MIQRIFDIENEKDYADLWDIFPTNTHKIELGRNDFYLYNGTCFIACIPCDIIKINWHDKTEITRPIQEATEADIGKICYFWDNYGVGTYGKLSSFILEDSPDRKFGSEYGSRWQHARRLTKQEIEELC